MEPQTPPPRRTIGVGVNGFPGRIAKCLVRQLAAGMHIGDRANLQLVGMNGPDKSPEYLLDLLQHDSVHGRFATPFAQQRPDLNSWLEDGRLCIGGGDKPTTSLALLDSRDKPDWGSIGADIVIDCTGKYCNAEKAQAHLALGASKVVISAPPKDGDVDAVAIFGINEGALTLDHNIVSAASCTTTALAPFAMAIEAAGIGIKLGFVTTTHSVTASNSVVDSSDMKDWNRGRSGLLNVYGTKTGAAKMIGRVVHSLNKRLTGSAVRGPWANGSMLTLNFVPRRSGVTVEDIREAFRVYAAANPSMMLLANRPTTTTDILTLPHYVIVDMLQITVQDEDDGTQLVTVQAFYDNEWGYSAALSGLTNHIAGLMLAA